MSRPKGVREIEGPHGWISPRGLYYHCSYEGHSCIIEKLVKMTQLHSSGWIANHRGWIQMSSCKFYSYLKEPTQAQISLVRKWCEEKDRDYDKCTFFCWDD